MENEELFDWDSRRFLMIAQTKRTQYPDGFDRGNYFENLTPIISANYHRAEKIVCCGRERRPCDQWSLCSKCAYMRGLLAVQMYDGTFNKTPFFHLTLGFDGDLPFNATNSVGCRAYWKMNEAAISHLVSNGIIDGAYMVHELKIRSFLPLRVNPHSHVVIAASHFDPAIIPTLREMIGTAAGIALTPSIDLKRIDSKDYHERCIRYLTKAIDLQEPYVSAWNLHCGRDRVRASELNREMREFLDAQAAAFGGMYRVVRMGSLLQSTKKFIGVKKADRERKKHSRKKKPNYAVKGAYKRVNG